LIYVLAIKDVPQYVYIDEDIQRVNGKK